MSKTKRKWLYLDYTHPDALRAQDVPYDSTESVKDAIDRAAAGVAGPKGATGLRGPTGLQGYTGVGPAGVTGLALGATGIVGPIGATGIQGGTGVQGLGGSTGAPGLTGIQGLTGFSGLPSYTGIQGVTGLRGYTGLALGATGLRGPTGIGGGGVSTVYNPISRYEAVTTSNEEVWLVSSSSVYAVPWDRTGTTLRISRTSHGHTPSNVVIVRNTNIDYQVAAIDATDSTSFSITTSNSGGTSGMDGAYSLGFTFQHDGSPKTGGTISAPSGDHADAQLVSLRLRTGGRSGTTYNLVVPASAINGAGQNTGLGDCYIPEFSVRTDSDNLSAVAGTIKTNISGSYTIFQFGNLGSQSRMIMAHF